MSDRSGSIPATETLAAPSVPLWTRTYILVCLAGLLAYVNYGLLAPTLPLFVDSLGASSITVGLALATFNIASFFLRPTVGYLVDGGRTRAVFGIGSLLTGLGTLCYLLPAVAMVFIGRTVQGIGWAGVNIGAYAMVATLAPPARRGEASGHFYTALTLPVAFLPSVALWLLERTDYAVIFVLAGLASVASASLPLAMRPDRPAERQSQAESMLARLVEPSALLPSLVLCLVNISFPAVFFFISLYAREQAIEQVALYFLIQGIVYAGTQAGLGGLSDRIGRVPAIAIGLIAAAVGLLLVSQATALPLLTLGGTVYTFGYGMVSPALFALVVDRAEPIRRGAATATFLLAYTFSSALGAFLSGIIVAWSGYQALYIAVAIPAVVGLGILLWSGRGGAKTGHA